MSRFRLPADLTPPRPPSVRRLRAVLSPHWLFLLFLAVGLVLRVLVSVAYRPALEFFGDSYVYLGVETTLRPSGQPSVYSLFLRALSPAGTLGVVPIVQHVLGLGMGIALYVFLLQLGGRRPLAALAAAPVLLDAYQLDIEQFVLAETLTDVLIVAALLVLLWRRRITPRWIAIVGALLAMATLTRTEVILIPVAVGGYLLLRRRWRPFLTYICALAVPVAAYGLWWNAVYGSFDFSSSIGYNLYGRVAGFATCDYRLPGSESRLCPRQP